MIIKKNTKSIDQKEEHSIQPKVTQPMKIDQLNSLKTLLEHAIHLEQGNPPIFCLLNHQSEFSSAHLGITALGNEGVVPLCIKNPMESEQTLEFLDNNKLQYLHIPEISRYYKKVIEGIEEETEKKKALHVFFSHLLKNENSILHV